MCLSDRSRESLHLPARRNSGLRFCILANVQTLAQEFAYITDGGFNRVSLIDTLTDAVFARGVALQCWYRLARFVTVFTAAALIAAGAAMLPQARAAGTGGDRQPEAAAMAGDSWCAGIPPGFGPPPERGGADRPPRQLGNSGAPHLHFQVMDSPSFADSTGLPFVFDTQLREGSISESAVPGFGEGAPVAIDRTGAGVRRARCRRATGCSVTIFRRSRAPGRCRILNRRTAFP